MKWEKEVSTYRCASTEEDELIRPPYDYMKTRAKLQELNRKISTLQHAIKAFETKTQVYGMDMTIDQGLEWLTLYQSNKTRLTCLANKTPIKRISCKTDIIDYEKANYDISLATADLEQLKEDEMNLKRAMNVTCVSETFEVDL